MFKTKRFYFYVNKKRIALNMNTMKKRKKKSKAVAG